MDYAKVKFVIMVASFGALFLSIIGSFCSLTGCQKMPLKKRVAEIFEGFAVLFVIFSLIMSIGFSLGVYNGNISDEAADEAADEQERMIRGR
ncbi:MAG: hypothetical protein ACOYL3_09080 [Desulfuromonadaceae bacterium]